jgi:hypothetical protein
VGAVLIQKGHPIAYINKSLGLKQQAMSIYEKEMLAIMHAVHKWRHYHWGNHFKIHINHVSLKYLLDQKIITPMQHQWLVKLMGYDYEIEYRRGKENLAADALSKNANTNSTPWLFPPSLPISWRKLQGLSKEIHIN